MTDISSCSENLVNNVINESAELFGKKPSDLSFINNKVFRDLVFKRANGNDDEIRNIIYLRLS